MAENDERRSFISDLVEINEDTQENDVPISENDDDKPDRETDCDEEKHVVPDLIEENCIVEAASNEEDRVTDLTALISSEHNLPNKVIQSIHEHQEDIFFQVGEKVSLDEFMIDD